MCWRWGQTPDIIRFEIDCNIWYTERSFVIECVIKNQLHGITQCNNVIAWIYYTFNYEKIMNSTTTTELQFITNSITL